MQFSIPEYAAYIMAKHVDSCVSLIFPCIYDDYPFFVLHDINLNILTFCDMLLRHLLYKDFLKFYRSVFQYYLYKKKIPQNFVKWIILFKICEIFEDFFFQYHIPLWQMVATSQDHVSCSM